VIQQATTARIVNGLAKKPMHDTLTVGITFDTKNDFKFTGEEPWDWDAEFAVSMAVDDISRALEDLGHRAVLIGSGIKLLVDFSKYKNQVDIVFNIAEGRFGRAREAQIPALLEMAGIPFVGSDAYALSLGLNKWHTKIIAQSFGIRTPQFTVLESHDQLDRSLVSRYPVFAKLCYEGSSMGLDEHSKIFDFSELQQRIRYLTRTYKQPVIVEEFITGTEIDVPIIGTRPHQVFGVVGISLDDKEMGERFLTSKIVYQDAYCFHYPVNASFEAETSKMALGIYNAIGCRDFGRADMRIDEEGKPYLLEINPYPFLGKHSSFNYVAEKSGLTYKEMIGMILQSAVDRYSQSHM
jgi:D-alanine-D-alanine ligase